MDWWAGGLVGTHTCTLLHSAHSAHSARRLRTPPAHTLVAQACPDSSVLHALVAVACGASLGSRGSLGLLGRFGSAGALPGPACWVRWVLGFGEGGGEEATRMSECLTYWSTFLVIQRRSRWGWALRGHGPEAKQRLSVSVLVLDNDQTSDE